MKNLPIAHPLVLVGATILAAGSAGAQAPAAAPSAAQQMFEKADTNHDGVLTLDEWTAAGRRERGFNMVDANHDGRVTPDELRAAAAKYGR